jgi:polygalacturonase
MPVWDSQKVRFDNLKIIGFRANSDGIDIYNSVDVTVNNCFIRSLDDLVVIKSYLKDTKRVTVENCVMFNGLAHPLEIGYELYGGEVSDILWRNCDVIHDQGREWTFGIRNWGNSAVSNVVYENIRIEECAPNNWLIKLSLNEFHDFAFNTTGYGTLQNVLFKDIDIKSANGWPVILMEGYNASHTIDGVTFQNVRINGQPLTQQRIQSNAFIKNVQFK